MNRMVKVWISGLRRWKGEFIKGILMGFLRILII